MIKLVSRLVGMEDALSRTILGLPSCVLKGNVKNIQPISKPSFQTIPDSRVKNNDIISPQAMSIIESMKHFGFEDGEIKALLNCQPHLTKKSSNAWHDIVKILLESGFNKSNVFTILEKWPNILNYNKKDLSKKLLNWTSFKFGDDLMYEIITTHPHFLTVNENGLKKRIKQYQILFESKRRVGKLLLISPNTLEENYKIICDKVNYLNELCTDNSDIVSSGVLSHTLFHIKARHEFLIRAGIYKKPQKDFVKKLSKNPRLVKIVNLPDEEFVSKVAGLSLFEYEVFLEMFEEEFQHTIEPGEIDSDDEDEIRKLSWKK